MFTLEQIKVINSFERNKRGGRSTGEVEGQKKIIIKSIFLKDLKFI